MKTKTVNRIFCLVVSLCMLVALSPTAAFAVDYEVSPNSLLGGIVRHFDNKTGKQLEYDVFPSELIDMPGESSLTGDPDISGPYTPVIPDGYREFTDDETGITYKLAKIVINLAKEYPDIVFDNPDNLYEVNIPENVTTFSLDYYWDMEGGTVDPDPDEPGGAPTVTNFIFSVDHNVAQNGTALTATKNENNVDVFRVTQNMDGQKTGLTVTYDTSMDMENLGISGLDGDSWGVDFADNAWGLLQLIRSFITDNTWVDLTFEFDDNINVSTDVDYSEAKLLSNMFVLKENTPYTVDEVNNALIVHCRWDKASATGTLDPMIYFNGLKVTLPADWDSSITITAGGNVKGKVIPSTGPQMDIDGGVAEDQFILKTKDKVSEPGMDKTIVLEDGTEVDKDTVAAGTTVEFQLESTVPERFAEIDYTFVQDQPPKGNAKGSYVLTFHDQMNEKLELNKDSFKIMVGDREIDQAYYTITTSDLKDDCTFEVELDLVKLYNAGIITEADFGITPITVNYTATLDDDAKAGQYLNTAWVHYPDDESTHDTVEVYTYGIDIFKYDQATDEGLKGAEFALYKEADVTVNEDGSVTVNGGAEPVWTGESGRDGHVFADGLDEGVYYLFETDAPTGYVKSDEPLKIVIPGEAGSTGDYRVDVQFANSQIPHTGGVGTTLFTIGGAAIIVGAGIVFVVTRRRKKVND